MAMQIVDTGPTGMLGGIPLEDFNELSDNAFAMDWKERFQIQRIQMIPDIARWMKVLRYFAPRRLEDHWQDQNGMPLPKLAESEGLSVLVANWCQPIIEVYGSLLAGQKPWPFFLDVRPMDAKIPSEMFRADSQEKLIMLQMEQQGIPLHFLDFCVSVMLFGIGWVYSFMDDKTRMLDTQAISWPGDVVPQWGSNRYGRGSKSLESAIITENMSIDMAQRLYPNTEFINGGITDLAFRPDAPMQALVAGGTTQILKVWYRWYDQSSESDKIGYAEIANSGTKEKSPAVLLREDDSQYPDIPLRWASRFNNPGEAPHKSAGILDNVIGINTEYNERLSAFSDLLMKFVYPKLKGKNYNVNTIPRISPKNNVIPLGMNQDLNIIQDIIQGGQAYFDSFLNRTEHFMMSSVGLTSIMMGSLPPGETSNAALETMIHSSLSRLEVVRTPIQWAWLSLFQEIWVPMLYKWGSYSAVDALTGKSHNVDLKELFDHFAGFVWTWPDVTPRDALRAIQTVLDQVNAGMMSKETGMEKMRVGSPSDELEKIRQEYQDPVLSPEKYRLIELAKQMSAPQQSVETGPKVSFTGQLDSQQIADILVQSGVDSNAVPGMENQKNTGSPLSANQNVASGGKGNIEKQAGQAKQANLEATAAAQPAKTNADNQATMARAGSESNAAQGLRGGNSGGLV